MAATLTESGELTYVSFPIDKTETDADGNLYVYGKATDGSVDSDEQIVDTDFSSKAIREWLETGANVRVQHNPQRDPAGVGVEVNTGPDGETWVKSLVVEPTAKALVLAKALRAYSVGIARPKIVRDNVARGGRIIDGEIVEISLVDRPANKNCGVELVKAEGEDGHAEFTGKVFGSHDLIAKGAAPVAPVSVETSSTFSPSDLQKLLAHRAEAEARAADVGKKDTDPSVGGGVDRDKIPSADFAGRDRSFPIVKPGDVSDAARSIGRAGSDNYSSDELRRRITSIAHRKGPEFVAQLPESWGSNKGVMPPFEPSVDPAESVDPEASVDPVSAIGDQPELASKGMKDCPKCGMSYDADSKMRKCEKCDAELPTATKSADDAADPDVEKSSGMKCMKCDKMVSSKFCPDCGSKVGPAMKADGPPMCDCGNPTSDCTCPPDCPDCSCNKSKSDKADKPTPGGGTKPVPAHREPDGAAVESFEHDAGLPTDPDREVKAMTRLKNAGAPTSLGYLHDLLCPAFNPAEVDSTYKSAEPPDLTWWQGKALDAATSAPLEEATKATAMWQHAVTLKGLDAGLLNEVRNDLYKRFTDANSDMGSMPTPMELSPTRFRRPHLTPGHADYGTGYDGPNTHAVPSGSLSAAQFTDGYIAGGHAAESPSNKGDANGVIGYPAETGKPTQVNYQAAQRNMALSAMSAMHDHVAQTFPDICAMHAPGHGGQPPEGARPVAAAKSAEPEVVKGADTTDLSAITTQMAEMTQAMKALGERVDTLTKELDLAKSTTADLVKSVEELGDLPDPATQPFKGVAQTAINKGVGGGAATAPTIAETVERTQRLMMAELENQFRTSPDPAQRESAWQSLMKMRGISPTG